MMTAFAGGTTWLPRHVRLPIDFQSDLKRRRMPVMWPVTESHEAAPDSAAPLLLASPVHCFHAGWRARRDADVAQNRTNRPAWFWTRLLVLPALTWCVAFGLRLHYFDEENDRLRAEERSHRGRTGDSAAFRTRTACCARLCWVALGSASVGEKIVLGETALAASTPHAGGTAIRHTVV